MPPPPRPADELRRLDALRASGLVESGADAELEAIVRRAAALFGTPIAAVTLLDGTLLRFKASLGLGVPYTTRDEAFCGYAILERAPLIVLDAQADPRFVDNPLVLAQPGIRFYAGSAVHGSGSYAFGALCVIDTVARTTVNAAAVQALCGLANEVSAIFSHARWLAG